MLNNNGYLEYVVNPFMHPNTLSIMFYTGNGQKVGTMECIIKLESSNTLIIKTYGNNQRPDDFSSNGSIYHLIKKE